MSELLSLPPHDNSVVFFENDRNVKIWMPAAEYQVMKQQWEQQQTDWWNFVFYGIEPPKPPYDPQVDLKWAWIIPNGSEDRKMCWVDNKTNQAFEADGYEKTTKEIKNFKFVRWCTNFDL